MMMERSVRHWLGTAEEYPEDLSKFNDPVLTEQEIAQIENLVGWSFPSDYRELVLCGGTNDPRAGLLYFPTQVVQNAFFVGPHHIPFAGNGCGDHYCWVHMGTSDEYVAFWDHESESSELLDDITFLDWLYAQGKG